jgi:hypothetical protein
MEGTSAVKEHLALIFSKAPCTDFELKDITEFLKLCLQDTSANVFFRYLYADLYASAMWTGTETPESSGNYTSSLISFGCSKNSPIPCDTAAGSPLPSLGYIYSFGEDNSKDVYVLASKGVYRVVRPSLCSYTCPTEKPETNNGKAPAGASSNAPDSGMGLQMGALSLSVIMSLVLIR